MSRAVIALAAALAACTGPMASIHTRTSPRRIDVTKQATSPKLVLAARRAGDRIEVIAKRATDFKVTRVVHYNAASTHYVRGSRLFKLVEVPLGVLALIYAPIFWGTPSVARNTSSSREEVHTNWILAMISPFQSLMMQQPVIEPSSAAVFVDPPIVREYRVNLPVPNLSMTYRALDDSERVIATGTLETDAFGRSQIASAARAIAIEVTIAGKVTVIPVAPELPP